MSLRLHFRLHGNVYVIQCTGRIVLGDEVRSLEAALEHGAQQSIRLVLNLKDVDRLDSIGLGLLTRFCTRLGARGGDLRLASLPAPIASLLRLTTLTRIFKLFPTEEEAIASFHRLGVLPKIPTPHGTRLFVFDPSPDLCVFLRSVLSCRGFEVRSANNLQDAKVLLGMEAAEILLIGPGTAQLRSASSASTLAECAPAAKVLQLRPDFKSLDAQQAADVLLALLVSGDSMYSSESKG